MTFTPSEQVIIALEDTTPTTTAFKNFQKTDKTDTFEMKKMHLGNREVEVIHSENLYKFFYEYLETRLDEYAVENIKHLIKEQGKIRFYYVTPKEILNVMPSSNISMLLYKNTYCMLFLTNTNDIAILLQATSPVTAYDENLYNIILSSIVKGCVRYVMSNKDVLTEHLKNDTIFSEYLIKTNEWYREFIKIMVDKYDMVKVSSKADSKKKNIIIDELHKTLLNIIKKAAHKRIIPNKELIEFFKYTVPKSTDILKNDSSRDSSNDLVRIKTIGIERNKEMMLKYLTEIFKPIESIFMDNIFQPEVLLSNQEYSVIVDIIKLAYTNTIDNVIDVMHFIKYTIFQELYHYHIISENYTSYKDNESDILEMLSKGEIFKF